MKSANESDSDTTMFYLSHSRMTVRYLSGKKKSATSVTELAEEFEENFTLEDFLDSLSEEEQRNALLHLSLLWAEKFK